MIDPEKVAPVPLYHGLGYCKLIDAMGSDERIIESARMSTGKGFQGWGPVPCGCREHGLVPSLNAPAPEVCPKCDGKGEVPGDEKLLAYLWKNRHVSPSEMGALVVEYEVPIFVERQMVRHRSACLSGDNELWFDLPNGIAKGRKGVIRRTISDIHRMWNDGVSMKASRKRIPTFIERVDADRWYTMPELAELVGRDALNLREVARKGLLRSEKIVVDDPCLPSIRVLGQWWHEYASKSFVTTVPMTDRLRKMHLRHCNEDTGEIDHTHIKDIWQTGIKPVFKVTFSNGYVTKMTADHRCLTKRGWQTLEQATGLHMSKDGNPVWRKNSDMFAANGEPCYRSKEWMMDQRSSGADVKAIAAAAGTSYHTIRKYLRQHGLQFSAKEKARFSGAKQRGTKRAKQGPRPLSPEALERVRAARCGEKSNFWKGGVTSQRSLDRVWSAKAATSVHKRFGYQCVLCGSGKSLHAHHVDPVWHNPSRARDETNLLSLCSPCHRTLHSQDLELALLGYVSTGEELKYFWQANGFVKPMSGPKAPRRSPKMVRKFVSVENIEYAGEEMTYEIEVESDQANFVCDGIVVHNSRNELSGRYSKFEERWWHPAPEDVRVQDTKNKQGSVAGSLSDEQREALARRFDAACKASFDEYLALIEGGMAREQARGVLPVAMMTRVRMSANLRNMLHMLGLRLDPHAQAETVELARAIASFVSLLFPRTWALFVADNECAKDVQPAKVTP